jgi:Zn-dependent metalloprotease
MIMKKMNYSKFCSLSIAMLCLLFNYSVLGQDQNQPPELYGAEAEKIVTGATMLKLNDQSSVPAFVMLNETSAIEQSEFLRWYTETFKIPKEYDFVIRKESTDDLNAIHIKYNVLYNGISMDLNWLNVHVKNNKVYQFNGNVQIISKLSTNPKLSEETALNSALNKINVNDYLWLNPQEEELLKSRNKDPQATYYPKGTLVIVQTDRGTQLAWRFDVRTSDPANDQQIFIDATSGEKIKSLPLSLNCDGGTVASTWYGTQNINTDINGDGDYILLDDCAGPEIHTTQTDGSDFTAADNNWTSSGETGAGTTHLHGRISMDYLTAIHNRDSYDDAGGDLEIRYIAQSNAYWSGGGLMRIGNSNSSDDDEHYNTLDVVAHEMFHGVTDFEANLVYQGESGALNESFSDIFGETCEMWYEGLPSNQWDWLHREDYFNGINRSLIDPNVVSDADTYLGNFWKNTGIGQPDAGGVHSNSGVQNYWFYVLTVGDIGTNDNGDDNNVSGIGLTKARTIAYDNLTAQLGVNSDFSDARTGAIAAAVARYGACSNEVKQVTNAWYAVGVGDPYVEVDLFSKTHVSCNGDADGLIYLNVDGTSPFTYAWSHGLPATKNQSGLSGGTYTVTVTDATGCTAMLDVTINEPDPLVANITGSSFFNGFSISCHGGNDGWATAQASDGTAPYTYAWDDPLAQSTKTATGLSAGFYTCTVTDANDCETTTAILITEPPLLTGTMTDESDYNGYNISCNGGSDGWATAAGGGGVMTYTYLWSDGQNTATATNLSAGYYSVTITDANGCIEMTDITLTEPTPLTIEAGPNQTVYYGYAPAECTDIEWSGEGGGVAPYTITWDDGGAQLHTVCPGINTTTYTVTITDANGCSESDEVTICVIDVRCGKNLNKVEMCHGPNGNSGKSNTICVSPNAVATHLAHGDMLAACGTDHSCDGNAKTAPIAQVNTDITLLNVYPNPVRENATVEFTTSAEGTLSVELYDNLGRLLKVIYNGEAQIGLEYKFEIQASELSSGLNLCILRHSNGSTITKKIIADK